MTPLGADCRYALLNIIRQSIKSRGVTMPESDGVNLNIRATRGSFFFLPCLNNHFRPQFCLRLTCKSENDNQLTLSACHAPLRRRGAAEIVTRRGQVFA